MISNDEIDTALDILSDAQVHRVFRRMRCHSAAFPDIRDAVAQAIVDELDAIAANHTRQPDDPGLDELPETDVGKYPGWLTAIIWLTPITAFWGTLAYWLFR